MNRSAVSAILVCAGLAPAQLVVPQAALNGGGSGAYSTVLNAGARSWLTVIGQAELNGRLPVGGQLHGVSFRNASWQAFGNWPAGTANFANFDVYVGQASLAPGSLDLAN